MSHTDIASRRVERGRLVTLIAAALYCAVRGIAYIPAIGPETLTGPVALISMDGHLLWLWNIAWFTAALFCVVDMKREGTRIGLSLTVGLTAMWGCAYLFAWAWSDFGSRQWLTGATMTLIAAIVFGLLYKVSALRDLLDLVLREREQAQDEGR